MKAFEPCDEVVRQLQSLPDSPGVYVFKNTAGEPIYIGKALNLKSRVRSYWNDTSWRERPKLAVLIPKVTNIELVLTNSEKEALLLEANLVRQHKPRYNVALKDDKRYPWLAIEYGVAFPRLIMVRDPMRYRKENPRAKLFGPYVETGQMWETVRVLRKVFPMRQRKTPLFKHRPCMNYYIGLCLGPCQKLVTDDVYNHMVGQVELFLAGRQSEVVSQLKTEMETAATNLNFEQAAKIRDRLAALETVIQKQQVFFASHKVSQDILAEGHTEKLMAACLMRVREGKLISSEVVFIPLTDKTNADEGFQSFIDQYYTSCEDVAIPQEVLLQHEVEDVAALVDLLSSRSKYSVKVHVPQRGNKLDLIDMAKKNAQTALDKELMDQADTDSRVLRILTSLKEELGISKLPRRIECFDISNIQGTDNVASMVVFEDSVPKKSDYRTFKVKGVEGVANDFASMKEVVGRRYSRLHQEGKAMPDLIIIDGGKGQLNAACEALAEIGITGVDIVGLAKKQEEVFPPGEKDPLLLSRRGDALHLLQRVRDEAHRFAVTFHRKRRAKRSLRSELDSLPGVGKARRKQLLDHFGSFDKIKEATEADLLAVPGLPKPLAKKIFELLNDAGETPALQAGGTPTEAQLETTDQ